MPISIMREVAQSVAEFTAAVESEMDPWLKAATPEGFLGVEVGLHQQARVLADAIAAAVLRRRLFTSACVSAAVATGKFRRNGSRRVKVTFLGGTTHSFTTAYLPAVRNGRHRRPQPGLLPVFAALGIWWNTSPALADEVARQVADAGSLRDGIDTLRRRGIALEYKRTLHLVQKFSQRAVEQRKAWVKQVLDGPARPGRSRLRGRTIMVAIDGGRLRERRAKRGHRRKSGHHAYHAPWCEPRQLVITVLDGQGRPDRRFVPIYDATLGNADELFFMLWAYLKALGANQAARLVFVADGADWIWRRVPWVALALGMLDKTVQVVDYSHAVQMLNTIAASCAGWSERQRRSWVDRVETKLYNGNIDAVVAAIREVAVGRRAKTILSHLPYFSDNVTRMQYPDLRRKHLPQGSGNVESAIRRVINMRLKSAGKFWLHENAEGMLHLRSYLKAGHWDHLVSRTLRLAIPWISAVNNFVPDMRRAS